MEIYEKIENMQKRMEKYENEVNYGNIFKKLKSHWNKNSNNIYINVTANRLVAALAALDVNELAHGTYSDWFRKSREATWLSNAGRACLSKSDASKWPQTIYMYIHDRFHLSSGRRIIIIFHLPTFWGGTTLRLTRGGWGAGAWGLGVGGLKGIFYGCWNPFWILLACFSLLWNHFKSTEFASI